MSWPESFCQCFQSLYGLYPATAAEAQQGTDLTYTNNASIMMILLDIDTPGGPNEGHKRNPQKHVFLNARMTTDATAPGIGPDYNFRDPWGRPYIITLDLNYDNKCEDSVYKPVVGIIPAPVLVWSLGRDGIPNPDKQKDDVRNW